jgi:ketosteroid isomerase-like protein
MGYALWNEGNIAGMAEQCLAEDVEFYPDPTGPWQRVYRGVDEVKRFLREEVAGTIGLSGIVIESETVVGDEVVFALRTQISGEQSGLELNDRVFHVTQIEGGRVRRIRGFLNEEDAMSSLDRR